MFVKLGVTVVVAVVCIVSYRDASLTFCNEGCLDIVVVVAVIVIEIVVIPVEARVFVIIEQSHVAVLIVLAGFALWLHLAGLCGLAYFARFARRRGCLACCHNS